jgi:hypothetical protein
MRKSRLKIKQKQQCMLSSLILLLKDLENKTPRSFRLGSKLYSEKIWIFNRVTADTILKGSQS